MYKLVTFANNWTTPGFYNFKTSLVAHGYSQDDFIILGKDMKWESFMTRIKVYHDYFLTLSKDTIVIVTDCYDVFANSTLSSLIEYYNEYYPKILIGSEKFCGNNCSPITNWWKYKNRKPTENQYANAGFYMGPVESITFMLKYMLSLRIKDDRNCNV